MSKKNSTKVMSIQDHIAELRIRLIVYLVFFTAAIVILAPHYDFLLLLITGHFIPFGQLSFMGVGEPFAIAVRVILACAFVVTLPVLIYQVIQFCKAAIKNPERNIMLLYALPALVLFLAGGSFAFFVVAPITLQFLMNFAGESLRPVITLNSYVAFVLNLTITFGIAFQVPIVMFALAKFDIATHKHLATLRRYLYVIIFILAALLTPPDPLSQLLMAVPILFLYEIGLLIMFITIKTHKK